MGRLDRCELPIECSDVNQDHPAVPAKLLDNLSQDADARTTHFVALAYPLPHSHLDLIQERMREMAEQNDAARRELAALRPLPQRVTKMEGEVALFRHLLKNARDRREALEELQTRNKSLSKAVRRTKDRLGSLELELQETQNQLESLRREKASLTETLHPG